MLGDELREARLKAGLTQQTLAEAIGMTREYVSLLELNKRLPTLPVLARICRASGVSTLELAQMIDRSSAAFPKPSPGLNRGGIRPAKKNARTSRK